MVKNTAGQKRKQQKNPLTTVIRAKYGTVRHFCAITGLKEATVRKVIEGAHTGALIGSESYKTVQAFKRRGILRAVEIVEQVRNDGKAA